MGQLINFPGKTRKRRQKISDVLVEKLQEPHVHVDVGQMRFTCPNCKHTANFDFTNMIFRTMSFFCAKCGNGYRITNPIFKNTAAGNNQEPNK